MSVHVRVEVTVELTLEQPWSDAESVGVVDAAAKREAVETIRRMSTGVKGLRVIGVDAVSMTLRRRGDS